MRIGILTRSLPPEVCGIGHHTMRLADALKAEGHDVVLIAGRGASEDGVCIIGDEWDSPALRRLQAILDSMRLDHLVLQYTPLMFSGGKWQVDQAIADFWRATSACLPTSLIVHETYFRFWWHPPSLLRGSWQKAILKAMVGSARHVFTASERLLKEISSWRGDRQVNWLPIGSNVPFNTGANPMELRCRYGLAPDTTVLLVFGEGSHFRWTTDYVNETQDALLQEQCLKSRWLLMGGVPQTWFKLQPPAIQPGWLSFEDLSAHLQMADLLVQPHATGLCAKRGTVLAGIQHGLPIVGLRGPITDAFWSSVDGVVLAEMGDRRGFANRVVALSKDADRRRALGASNLKYFEAHMTWPKIVRMFLSAISSERVDPISPYSDH